MAASNTSTLNLGGDDGMYNIPPEPQEAQQSQSAANSTQGSGDGNASKQPLRYPLDKIQETQDFLLISILDIDRGKNESSDPREIFGNTFYQVRGPNTYPLPNPPNPSDPSDIANVGGTQLGINLNGLNVDSFTDFFNSEANAETRGELFKNAQNIFLPIPQKVTDSLKVGYSEDRMSPLGLAAAGAVGAMLDADVTKGAQTAGSIMQVLKSVTGGAQIDMTGADTNALKQALAGNILGGFQNITPNMLVSRASGQILQSNLELLFSGVALRSFPFVFDFAPRDENEAEMVAKIIKTIKMGMAPRKGRGLLIQSPHYFKFQYFSGKQQHPFLNKFKIGILSDMSVDYTASGTYATYGGKLKSPVHMRMQLTFREINPIYREDYEEMGDISGVGY
tara:strand:+ start:203 stop:1384 length:1182 start_codon:yes stop_codon:yes gene_type:complete